MATMIMSYICKKMTFIFIFLFFHTVITFVSTAAKNECQFAVPGKREEYLLSVLEPLKGKVFQTQDDKYKYSVGICTDVNSSLPFVGVIQTKDNRNIAIGYYNESEIMGGKNWILLTYTSGETHVTQCEQADRMAVIMIICDSTLKKEELSILEERVKHITKRCFYLFELSTSATCNEKPDEGLSAGSVFFLIFFTLTGIYFLLGFLYQRLVVGAKGLEQIPNYTFWKYFGNLQADGCDYVCRCGPRQESQAYRGLDDRLGREEEERDDQLLTM